MKKITLLLVALLCFNFSINSQSKKLSIIVKDSKNKPIPGAIILFDDIRQKKWTNAKGEYKIKLEKTPKEISAFSPKIGIQKIKYNGQKTVLIKILKGKDKNLITFNNDNNSVNSNLFQYANIYDYLRGKVPGVNISGGNISIRGNNTINGNSTPLFVLNGNVVNQDLFSQIAPIDIKSVKVLKGPESSKYGVRGANGVIEVFSK